MKRHIHSLGLISGAILLLSSCGSRDMRKPGKIFMPDMTYSQAYETYSQGTLDNGRGDTMSAREPVANTIPFGTLPADPALRSSDAYLAAYLSKNYFTHDPAKWQEEYDKAGQLIRNPLASSKEVLEQGKAIYLTNCVVCHGEKGNGDGNLVVLPDGSDGPYTAVPPAYSKRLPEISDGNIFYSVSYGKGQMGGYGFSLSVEERWKVISYIKSLAGLDKPAAETATPAAPVAAAK
jgi:mono/diheme cytochrome c family protein